MRPDPVNRYKYYKHSSVIGARWIGVGEFLTRLFQFIVTVILARFLTPTDFGLVAFSRRRSNNSGCYRFWFICCAYPKVRGNGESISFLV
ncbi:MAG: oligosaccharide flippase family protein [Aliifodinibius sp.]|nr:oligosaccharide flippase family protein [Fodinibius sp.]